MSVGLQRIPPIEESCLDLGLAYQIVANVCQGIGFNFSPERLTSIAVAFDICIQAGESAPRAMMTAIDYEIAQRGRPGMKKKQPAQLPQAHQEKSNGCGLQRVPPEEEALLLAFVEAVGISRSTLVCKFSRQKGDGNFRDYRERTWAISFDLVLCEYCGNFEGMRQNTPYCPAKLRALRSQMIAENRVGPLTLPESE